MTKTTDQSARKIARKIERDKQLKLQEQARLLKDHMSTAAAEVVAYRETSGDYGDMSQQSEQEWLFLNQNRANAKELSLIEKALRRIKDGGYGFCTRCAQPISPQRLRAIPWAECCVECQDDSRSAMSVVA
jgi:RNA polymerase-binding protein DksA